MKKLKSILRTEISESQSYIGVSIIGVVGGVVGVLISPLLLFGVTKAMQKLGWNLRYRYLIWAIGFSLCLPFAAAIQLRIADSQLPQAIPSASSAEEIYHLGEEVRSDLSPNLGIRVMAYRRSNGLYTLGAFGKPIEGNLVIVSFEKINFSNQIDHLCRADGLKLEAEESGNKYVEVNPGSYSLWRFESGLGTRSEELAPGEVRDGVAVFSLSEEDVESNEYSLLWRDKKISLEGGSAEPLKSN